MREPEGAIDRWAARGPGRSLSTACDIVSAFPRFGLTHRRPGFSRTRVTGSWSDGPLRGVAPRREVARARSVPSERQTRAKEEAFRYRSVQWETGGLCSLRAIEKKIACSCAPATFYPINSPGKIVLGRCCDWPYFTEGERMDAQTWILTRIWTQETVLTSATIVICLYVMKAAEGRFWPLVAWVALVLWTSAQTLGSLSYV